MKNKRKIQLLFSFILAALVINTFSCSSSNPPTAPANTTGLTVSVATGTTGGNYAPRNVVAIWIEDNAGKFVKTLTVYAQARTYDLTNWNTSSAGNMTDAVTGATQTSYNTIYGNWNGTDATGKVVADGVYKVCMELTDKGSTGNFSTFPFTKGTVAATLTPASVPSFSSISIKWVPL